MRHFLIFLFTSFLIPGFAQTYVPGYQSSIKGEELQYHSPQPDAGVSLLVRSEDSIRYIEWQSSPLPLVPASPPPSFPASPFLLLAGIDVNPTDPHHWKVYINDKLYFNISSPLDTLTKELSWPGPDGASLVFKTSEVDKYGDFMGYLFFNLPASVLEAGKPVRFRVVGESAGSRTWFMVFKYTTTDKVGLYAEQAVLRGPKENSQVLRAEIVHYSDPVPVKIDISGKKMKMDLGFGYNVFYLPVPEITTETAISVKVSAGKTVLADKLFNIRPVAPRTIYLLHHSHNDIGYTDVQPEVEKKQWENLDRAVAVSDSTKDFPPGARMKWCTEVIWAVESYYDKADPAKKEAFREAVKSGRIELNGLYANELTSLCGPEELDRLLEAGRRISGECGVPLTSAMITDIPGWSWATVTALANSGVKYFSIGTNRGDRIGNILEVWGDKPFYWVSPSGEEKVLCWIHGEGYSLFHTGLAYTAIRKRLQEDLIFGYMDKLVKEQYPYEEVMLRYNIGSDNGPLDETLPQAVKEWNEKYVTPQILISTVDEAFSSFEQKHGSELPQISGDLTGYWEDGAFSTTRETEINRRTASRLIQAQALWAICNPVAYPEDKIRDTWRSVLLFDEHTWGSWNSVSEPDAPFTQQQWEIKKSFALEADKQSKKLLMDAMVSKMLGGPATESVEVFNTCGWTRSGLVSIKGGTPGTDITMADSEGNELPAQATSDGNILFIAKDIPALGSKIYKIINNPQKPGTRNLELGTQNPNPVTRNSEPRNPEPGTGNQPPTFTSSTFTLSIDPSSGSISSLIFKANGKEMVDRSAFAGLNEYLYVEGRMPDSPLKAKLKDVRLTEDGPVLKTIRLQLDAPGCDSMTVWIRLIDQLNIVEIIDNIGRKKVLTTEAIHIAFPFSIEGGTTRYDLAYGYCRPELDQLQGANRNYIAMEHWLDISGMNSGVTVICPDAPLFEPGKIMMDAKVYGWVDTIPATQTFLSYLMNNYWETNFAASQKGYSSTRYIIMPNNGFDPAGAEKAAIEQRQPLLARRGGNWLKDKPSLLTIENPSLVITSLKPINKGSEVIVSVYNAGLNEEIPTWGPMVKQIVITNPDGVEEEGNAQKAIPPGGIRHFKITL